MWLVLGLSYWFSYYVSCRNLQSNGLTGRLPPELGNLGHLEVLQLDRNRLRGTVPAGSNPDFTSSDHGM